MKSMLEELKDVKIKKHTVTSIEYDCKSEKKRTKYLIRFIILSQIIWMTSQKLLLMWKRITK